METELLVAILSIISVMITISIKPRLDEFYINKSKKTKFLSFLINYNKSIPIY